MAEMDDAEPAAPFQSRLADRLYRRASGPLGVIDVSVPHRRYERATAWTQRHLLAIDRALARLTPGDAEQHFASDYSTAAKYLTGATGGQQVGSWSDEGIRAPMAAGPSMAGRAGKGSGDEASNTVAGVARLQPALRVAPVARTRAQVISRLARPDSDSTEASVSRRPLAGHRLENTTHAPSPTDSPGAPFLAPAAGQWSARSSETLGGAAVPPDLLRAPDPSRGPASGGATFSQRHVHEESGSSVAMTTKDAAPGRINPWIHESPDGSRLLGSTLARPPRWPRPANTSEPVATAGEPARPLSPSGAPSSSWGPSLLPATSAIVQRHADAPRPDVVWRMAAAGTLQRASGNAADAWTRLAPALAAPAATAGVDGAGESVGPDAASIPRERDEESPDAAELTEQVTRRLLRRIEVERERRGGRLWP